MTRIVTIKPTPPRREWYDDIPQDTRYHTGFGFAFLVVLAALSRVDRSMLEAASLDGAGEWRSAWAIVVPAIRPSLLFLVVTQTIAGLQVFTQVQVLTRGGPSGATTTLVYELYQRAFGTGLPQYGQASTIALTLLLLVVLVTDTMSGGPSRRPTWLVRSQT